MFLVLAAGLLALLLCAARLESKEGLGLISGYILFALNFLFLMKIYGGLVTVMQTGKSSARLKTGLLVGSAIKFLGLIAALYALIVLYQLPGLFIAIGSLVSLFLLTTLLVLSYLQTYSSSSAS